MLFHQPLLSLIHTNSCRLRPKIMPLWTSTTNSTTIIKICNSSFSRKICRTPRRRRPPFSRVAPPHNSLHRLTLALTCTCTRRRGNPLAAVIRRRPTTRKACICRPCRRLRTRLTRSRNFLLTPKRKAKLWSTSPHQKPWPLAMLGRLMGRVA